MGSQGRLEDFFLVIRTWSFSFCLHEISRERATKQKAVGTYAYIMICSYTLHLLFQKNEDVRSKQSS